MGSIIYGGAIMTLLRTYHSGVVPVLPAPDFNVDFPRAPDFNVDLNVVRGALAISMLISPEPPISMLI
jgi:hypothetical protein